jgi:dTDP-4-dehydrorhamnose reductase/UDP-glucose 4-epimerase
MKKVLVIGKKSFMAKAFISHNRGRFECTAISHDEEIGSQALEEFSCILNMAYDPGYFREPYSAKLDFDLQVARKVAGKGPHFFMMSSRKVYGTGAPFPTSEGAPVAPTDQYGNNKAVTEQAVRTLLGPKCTVLRIANVFGFELGRHTFFGIALSNLIRERRIVLDVSPFTRRDFLSVEGFAEMLGRTVEVSPPDTFNMGSGKAYPIGQIALWLIEGFGGGELVVNATAERDSFLLDTTKLNEIIGYDDIHNEDMRARCVEIGRRLKNA